MGNAPAPGYSMFPVIRRIRKGFRKLAPEFHAPWLVVLEAVPSLCIPPQAIPNSPKTAVTFGRTATPTDDAEGSPAHTHAGHARTGKGAYRPDPCGRNRPFPRAHSPV